MKKIPHHYFFKTRYYENVIKKHCKIAKGCPEHISSVVRCVNVSVGIVPPVQCLAGGEPGLQPIKPGLRATVHYQT